MIMNNDTSQPYQYPMDQPIRPKRNKSLPARLAAGGCDLYDFHPSSDNMELFSATPSCATSFRQSNTNTSSTAPLAQHTTQRRAHIITFDRSTITRASCDPSIGLPDHQSPQPQQTTSNEAPHNMSDKDSAVCVRKTKTRNGKRIGRRNQNKDTNTRVQAKDDLGYLDRILATSLIQEKKENAKLNWDRFWLYDFRRQRSDSGPIIPSAHQEGDVIGKIRYIVRPPEPRYWERAHYKQRWESTEAAKAFDVTYTEADDFSTSEEDEPEQPNSSASTTHLNIADQQHALYDPPPLDFIDRLNLISLLDLPNTLARHILNTILKDCITKYGVPGWLCQAQSILKLSPKEFDWMEDNRLRCLGLQSSQATPDVVENSWLCYDTKRLHREERQRYLDQEPSNALAWLDEDYKDWFCTKEEVKSAILYLLQRGWSLKMAEEMDFGQFLEVESDNESDGDDEKEEGGGDDNNDEDSEMGEAKDDRRDGQKEDSAVFED